MKKLFFFLSLIWLLACQQNPSSQIPFNQNMQTHANYEQVACRHLDWDVQVDFDQKVIKGSAQWIFNNKQQSNHIIFDTRDLKIEKVLVNNKEASFELGKLFGDFGQGLSIPIQKGDTVVKIFYQTSPEATAIQWLAPSQTAGKKLPYLFTQCESIHARSLLPCQDVPAQRITYNAKVKTPENMMAVMSAKNPRQRNPTGEYQFTMEIPVPSYLIALAVGDLQYKAINERSGVYTEPSMLDKAAEELSDIPAMLQAAEELGGPYRWGNYDVLIAPPSFPIGGMENPRLTFATPTIIAGDKSLVSLIAHEMAHSWSGNLVTNATWNDLWLNEGFTTYFERRIMEKIAGKSYNDMLWELGYQDLQMDLKDFGEKHEDTKLRIELKERHPEDAFSNIPYEKGAVFIRLLEETVGREKFDAFLNKYFTEHAFIPMTTEKCLAFMDAHLFNENPGAKEKINVQAWVYGTGLLNNCPHVFPERFKQVEEQLNLFKSQGANTIQTGNWSTHEWLHFLRNLPHPLAIDKMKDLDTRFNLTATTNSEIADEWFKLAIHSGYETAFPNMETFLSGVGRKKFLIPLYTQMLASEKYKAKANDLFTQYRNNYHPQTASKIESLLKGK